MSEARRDPDQRPSPEALLEAARREESRAGKLRIFVGAALPTFVRSAATRPVSYTHLTLPTN